MIVVRDPGRQINQSTSASSFERYQKYRQLSRQSWKILVEEQDEEDSRKPNDIKVTDSMTPDASGLGKRRRFDCDNDG